jgi:oxalate decarboxylase/phosphoglucose isomerase-like protein (cupin superfamily)
MEADSWSTHPFVERVEKPWGYELLFTPSGKPYAGKLLHVNAGRRLSLQYHDGKWETILLLSGRADLQVDAADGTLATIAMEPMKGYSVVPGQRHRLIAREDCVFVEASTPETGTTYRLEDDSGRGNETESVRGEPNRGWRSRMAGSA